MTVVERNLNLNGGNMNIFGLKNQDGNVDLLFIEDGYPVTRLDEEMPIVYPVGSNFSAHYEHPEGITLTLTDAKKLSIEIEQENNMNTQTKPSFSFNGYGSIDAVVEKINNSTIYGSEMYTPEYLACAYALEASEEWIDLDDKESITLNVDAHLDVLIENGAKFNKSEALEMAFLPASED